MVSLAGCACKLQILCLCEHITLTQAPVLHLIFVNVHKFFPEQVWFFCYLFFCFLMCSQRADAVENVIKLQMHRVLRLNVFGNIALKYHFSSCLLLPQTSSSREPSKTAMLRMTKFNLQISCFQNGRTRFSTNSA